LSTHLLEMTNIHKKFPGVYALKSVNLTLEKGEVLALVGENGAGKSTLINVLGGIYQRDEGEIFIEGQDSHIDSVLAARDAGISIIHQELVLIPYLSVAENIFVHREPLKNGFIDYKTMYSKAQQFVDDLGIELDVYKKPIELSIAEQQMLEIVKAVSFKAKIIVMDEPTSALSDKEIDALFECIHRLKAQGIGIIYISHKLSELSLIADRVTILRDGETVTTMKINETNNDEIVRHMVGREITSYYTRTYNKSKKIVLSIKNITTTKVSNVSFDVREGEILGLSGLVGAGRTETVRGILGFDHLLSGEIFLNGEKVIFKRPIEAYNNKIGYVPENRREEGIYPLHTMRFNTTIKVLKDFIRGIYVNFKKEEEITESFIKQLKIVTTSQLTAMQNLSGGNQQKCVLASWLATKPKVLILDEPTRGIDVGSKSEIYALMNDLAKQGMAIIMISSELPEIINMSDRVVVMREGSVSRILEHDEISQEEIMKHAVHI